MPDETVCFTYFDILLPVVDEKCVAGGKGEAAQSKCVNGGVGFHQSFDA